VAADPVPSPLEFAEPGNMRRWLVGLVVDGHKRATAGLMSDYEAEGESIEEVGDLQTVVDDDGLPVADVVVTEVRIVRLADVPWEFVEAENEGDVSLAQWRAGHEAYWESVDCHVDDDTLVVLVWFELGKVHRDWPIPRVPRHAVEVLG
jgi:uncharacterized protein YhfF